MRRDELIFAITRGKHIKGTYRQSFYVFQYKLKASWVLLHSGGPFNKSLVEIMDRFR